MQDGYLGITMIDIQANTSTLIKNVNGRDNRGIFVEKKNNKLIIITNEKIDKKISLVQLEVTLD